MKAKHGVLACEVCLEDMSNLEVVVKALREERRQQLRNRAAMLVLNGKGGRPCTSQCKPPYVSIANKHQTHINVPYFKPSYVRRIVEYDWTTR